MAISNSMKFKIDTLIDITETNVRRQDNDKFAYKQQANFQTLLQTIGLRCNINYDKSPTFGELNIAKLLFSDKYIGKQKMWTFYFEVEYQEALNIDMLNKDFDLIPIITGLEETINLNKALFRTTDKERNILFSIVD